MPNKRILIIDDEGSVTRLVKVNLERTGLYVVRAENNAHRALAAAREFQPDLVLLDVVMPDMDGGDIAAQFQADPLLKDVPIVFLTATVAKKETSDGSLISGGLRFLAKPVNLKDLIHCIESNVK